MFNKKAVALFFLLFVSLRPAEAAERPKVDIVYDAAFRYGEPQSVLVSLQEYLGHFDVDQKTVSVRNWRPGAIRDANIVVVLGLRKTKLPQGLLREVAGAGKILWIEGNVEQLARYLHWTDFRLREKTDGWMSAASPSGDHAIPDWMQCYVATPGGDAEVYDRVKRPMESGALSWRRGNVYYLGCLDFFEVSMRTAFTNLLSHVIPAEYAKTLSRPRKVLLRIEDVSPLSDAEAVRKVLAVPEKLGIPFAIGVISLGDAKDGSWRALHENPKLVKVLQEAQADGASIIMHGYEHRNRFSPTTGEGWEFWNIRDDRPMQNDAAFTRDRIEKAFVELARCGLWPVAFEPPHYAMSHKGYRVLSRYFNILSGMEQISDVSYETTVTFPYIVKSRYAYGMTILPENMGYYDGKDSRVGDMLRNSRMLLDVPAPFACFFYHGYLPPDHLMPVIQGVLRQGYTFFDIRTLNVRAGSSRVRVAVRDGKVSGTVDPSLVARWKAEKAQKMNLASGLREAGRVEALLLLIAIGVIACVIVHVKQVVRRRYGA